MQRSKQEFPKQGTMGSPKGAPAVPKTKNGALKAVTELPYYEVIFRRAAFVLADENDLPKSRQLRESWQREGPQHQHLTTYEENFQH